MAIVKKGTLLDGLSGRVGDLVFRTRGEKTIVSIRPSQRHEPERSVARERTISRFQAAVEFAREARHRPAFRSLARMLRGYSPYHVALQDYLSEPVIEAIDAARVGPSGGDLRIEVSEKIAIRSVRVSMPALGEDGPAPAPELEVPAPADVLAAPTEKERRVPIPAALFFRQTPRESPDDRGPWADLKREASPVAPSGDPRKFQALAARIGAQSARERTPGEPLQEVWGVKLPRGGEVEITATDYAGNRASVRLRVGETEPASGAAHPERS